jgi:hypothetical protein
LDQDTPQEGLQAPTITSPSPVHTRPYPKAPNHGKRGPDKSRRVRKGEQPTQAEVMHVATLAGAGENKSGIARATMMSTQLVQKILDRPDIKDYIQKCRDAFKSIAMDSLVQVQLDTLDWAKDVASTRSSAKDLELVTRSIVNMDKVTSSASGENKPQINVNNQILHADIDMELDQLKKFLVG